MKVSTVATALALLLAGPALAEEAPAPAAAATPAAAQSGTPTASDLLFDYPSMKNTAPGSTLTYDYLRRSGIEKGPFGAPSRIRSP